MAHTKPKKPCANTKKLNPFPNPLKKPPATSKGKKPSPPRHDLPLRCRQATLETAKVACSTPSNRPLRLTLHSAKSCVADPPSTARKGLSMSKMFRQALKKVTPKKNDDDGDDVSDLVQRPDDSDYS